MGREIGSIYLVVAVVVVQMVYSRCCQGSSRRRSSTMIMRLVRHVQQNAGIQDSETTRQYTQQGVDI